MKRILFLCHSALVMFCMLPLSGQAAFFRLGFPGETLSGIDYAWNDYSSLEAAASNGDTVQVYQHYFPTNSSQSFSVTKTLHFIGYGYLLDQNTGLQVYTRPDSIYNAPITISFDAGSSGSTVQGLYLHQAWISDVNNITIRRCRIRETIVLNNSATINAIQVIACFGRYYESDQQGFNVLTNSSVPVTNFKCVNSYLNAISLAAGSTGTIANNVFSPQAGGYVNCYSGGGPSSNVAIKNNIITNDQQNNCFIDPTGNLGLISRNVFAYPAANCTAVNGNGNIYNVVMASTFSNWNAGSIYKDAQLAVQTTSSAYTNGRTNSNATTQCGLFGGETAELYVLSGIPALPSIYSNTFLSVIAPTTSTYTGTVSTRSNSSSNVNRIEYYIDTDPGRGLATSVSAFTASTNVINKSVSISVGALPAGMHKLVFRSRDASNRWSLNQIKWFYKEAAPAAATTLSQVSQLEYFIDNDPGTGNGNNISITPATQISNLTVPVNTSSLSEGIHQFHVRSRDANGGWSLVNSILFYKPYTQTIGPSVLPQITKVEFYLDDDPGLGLATNVSITPGTQLSNVVIPLDPGTLSEGIHRFHVRAQDANGNWSLVNSSLFYKPYGGGNTTPTSLPNLTRIEYFIDADPGYGQATAVVMSPGTNASNLMISIDPTLFSPGIHYLTVRGLDANGSWSMLNQTTFHHILPAVSTTPLVLTGFNQDVIAEVPNDAFSSTTTSFDLTVSNVWALMAQSHNPGGQAYLPNNGQLNSAFRPGVQYQLQPYNANNVLQLGQWANITGTLTLSTPVSAQDIYILAGSVGEDASVDVYVHHTDMSIDTLSMQIPEWYDGQDYAVKGIGRTHRWYSNGAVIEDDINNPRLASIKLVIPPGSVNKPIQSFEFFKQNYHATNIFAISIGNACSGIPAPGNTLAAASSVCYGDTAHLSLQNPFQGSGISYQWQSSDNSSFTQNLSMLGTSYAQDVIQYGPKFYRCQVSCNQGGSAFSSPVFVTTHSLPVISVQASPSAVCFGSSSNLTASGAVSYHWVNDNSLINPFVASPLAPTTYTVIGTDANGCSSSQTIQLNVHPLPIVTASDVQGCSGFPITLAGQPSGGIFSETNPYTGPSTTYTYTYTHANGCTAISAPASIDIVGSVTWYQDNDNDGYGNSAVSQTTCSQPLGYVQNDQDCDDTDSLEQPGMIWYIDQDSDGYGTGNYVVQCFRPQGGYGATELTAIEGDCNDLDAATNPGARYFVLSNTPSYPNVMINPLTGGAGTSYQFEVTYFDASNTLSPSSFPRMVLDYEGNGYYDDVNDRTLVMSEFDVNDQTTSDGKKYIATTANLPAGQSWKTHVETNNGGCVTKSGPYDYPDVLLQTDLEIFANDITFSQPNPPVASQLTIDAVIHNESDYAAQNFVVHLLNQYDTLAVYPDVSVPYLGPHSYVTVSWTITTPAVPAWCPMKVSVDYTNVINESNELDNQAIRPFINGNYNLPGGINTYPSASPAVSYAPPYGSSVVYVLGGAFYYGTAVPLQDSSVAGATVNFTIVETNAQYSGYTDSWGQFSIPVPKPSIPGIYHVVGTVTDFTLTDSFETTFEILPLLCNVDLTLGIAPVPGITIVQGQSVTGSFSVGNSGVNTSLPTTVWVSHNGGTPIINSFSVPAMAPNAGYTQNYTLYFANPGYYSICGNVDPLNQNAECIEDNNGACIYVHVLPALPDIVPGNWYQNPLVSDCEVNGINFELRNDGGANTGTFDCTVYTKRNGNYIDTFVHTVADIAHALSGNNLYGFTMPFSNPDTGEYVFELRPDLPANAVYEISEVNNEANHGFEVVACKPNVYFEACNGFDVASADGNYTAGTVITLKGRLYNAGNLAYSGPMDIQYQVGATVLNQTLNVNLPAYGATYQDVSITTTAPVPSSSLLTMTADPNDLVDESDELNNSISDSLCWDLEPVPTCSTPWWNFIYQQYHTMYLSVGVASHHLYDADTLRVKFEVSGPGISGTQFLGYAYLYDVDKNCFCPHVATLPTSFAFQYTGTYTFTMTVDPDNWYAECNEGNNVLVKQVVITDLPDMRILSQYIAPSKLNPDQNEAITMHVSYENVGRSNQADAMKMQVYVDNNLFATLNPVSGLFHGEDTTLVIPGSYASNLAGIHVIRAIIDADSTLAEYDESNNEATRSFIVGQSANLYFSSFKTINPNPPLGQSVNLRAWIANNGDLDCDADVQFYYVNNNLDTIYIGSKPVHVDGNDSSLVIQPWLVTDDKTTLLARIVNSNTLEFTYDDNTSWYRIGEMQVVLSGTPACNSGGLGTLTANVNGGEAPFTYQWNTTYVGQVLSAPPGQYGVVVSDATGQTMSSSGNIVACPAIVFNLKAFIEGYMSGTAQMATVLTNSGIPALGNYCDSVTVELVDEVNFTTVASVKTVLTTDGTILAYFPSNLIGGWYYLVLKHRNAVSVWSPDPLEIFPVMPYDFSNDDLQAYGNNLLEVSPGVYALYSGDINQDGVVDGLDYNEWELDNNNFAAGYFSSDLNGDGIVDGLDFLLWEVNNNNFVGVVSP